MSSRLLEEQMPVDLGHRVPLIERRFDHTEYLGRPETDRLKERAPLCDRVVEGCIVVDTHDPMRIAPQKGGGKRRTDHLWIEGVRPFLIPRKELGNFCHVAPL